MRWLGIMVCTLILSALTPQPAGAQHAAAANTEQAKERARVLADGGAELFETGRYAEALDAFLEAERNYHAPTILLWVARCHDRLGHLLEARATYERVLAEPLDASAPQVFIEAQKIANPELDALNRRIPALQVLVTGVAASKVTLSVNGAAIAPNGEPMPIDPGRAVVVASIPGRQPIERAITLQEGRTERLTLDLSRPILIAPAPAAVAPHAPSVVPHAPSRGSLLPAYIAFGAAGLGLGVGTVTAVVAKGQVDDIKSRCTPDGHCPRADQPKADRAQTLITVSTVGFVAGGVAAVAGVTLLVLRPGGGALAAPKDAAARVLLGPGSVQVVGRF